MSSAPTPIAGSIAGQNPGPSACRSPSHALRLGTQFGQRRQAAAITIERNGASRRFAISPVTVSILFFFAATFLVGYLAATSYLLFRDNLFGLVRDRDIALRQKYEDRIATLRIELDRAASRQLLDQQLIENQLGELQRRQQVLDGGDGRLGHLADDARRRGIAVPQIGAEPVGEQADDESKLSGRSPQASLADGADLDRTVADLANGLRGSSGITDLRGGSELASLDSTMSQFAATIGAIDAQQRQWVGRLRQAAELRASKLEQVVSRLAPEGSDAGATTQATGGPFLPVNPAAKFDDHVNALQIAFRRLDTLSLRIDRLPLSPPLRDTYVTSSFGNRADPFLGTTAMHSGIDFAAASGTSVPAVAAGTVIEAGESGGYGNMVEIDHGNGLSTRYAHLSLILVKPGDRVTRGQEIAESGSTGRSTGPHLHYEIRRNGEPIDPRTFLEAGRELGISGAIARN